MIWLGCKAASKSGGKESAPVTQDFARAGGILAKIIECWFEGRVGAACDRLSMALNFKLTRQQAMGRLDFGGLLRFIAPSLSRDKPDPCRPGQRRLAQTDPGGQHPTARCALGCETAFCGNRLAEARENCTCAAAVCRQGLRNLNV